MSGVTPDTNIDRPPWHVQIRRQSTGPPVGAGVYCGDGMVLTCAHVVGNTWQTPDTTVYVEFQFIPTPEAIPAKVAEGLWFPEREYKEGDIAVLHLDEPVPSGAAPAPFALGQGRLWHHPFRVYGYPKGDEREGVLALGTIVGSAKTEWIQLEARSELGYTLEPGFSGAPIWDETLGAVVGIAVTRARPRGEAGDPRTGYAIPMDTVRAYWDGFSCLQTSGTAPQGIDSATADALLEQLPAARRQLYEAPSRRLSELLGLYESVELVREAWISVGSSAPPPDGPLRLLRARADTFSDQRGLLVLTGARLFFVDNEDASSDWLIPFDEIAAIEIEQLPVWAPATLICEQCHFENRMASDGPCSRCQGEGVISTAGSIILTTLVSETQLFWEIPDSAAARSVANAVDAISR
jgi:hypothetical protein